MGNDWGKAKRWQRAKVAVLPVRQWLAFRFLFANQFNAHKPQRAQRPTKRMAKEVAGEIIRSLGGELMASPPPGLEKDMQWKEFMESVIRMDVNERISMMALVVSNSNPTRQLVESWRRLSGLLRAMHLQAAANRGGWCAVDGWKGRRKWRPKKKAK